MGVHCHLSRLSGCGVVIQVGPVRMLVGICCLMIKHIHPLQQVVERGDISCVTTEGIAAGGVRRCREAAVTDDVAFRVGPVESRSDVVNLTEGNLIEIEHITPYVPLALFFAEEIAATWHTVLQGDGSHGHAVVFIDDLALSGVHFVYDDLIFQSWAEILQLGGQYVIQVLMRINVERSRPAQQSECAEHTHQSEAVVAMKM